MALRQPTGERPFCGREEQLEALLATWQEVRGGLSGPRTVVLLAESGLGKTRLAQRFYDELVALEQSGGGYWPATLGTDGNNLLVNPATADFDPQADMPFLWWGVRLADPHGHNQVTTGSLAAHVDDFLVPHLAAFHKEQRRRQRLLQLAKVGGAVAADAVLDLVPFLGLLKKVGEVGMELKGIHDSWRQDRQVLDPAALLEQRRDSLVEQLIADFDKLFTGPAGRRVPAVILIDDAQFSASDPGVTAFLAALIPAMTAGRWPVMLLVTHWEREYSEGTGTGGEGSGSPVAGIIDEHSRQELGAVRVMRLTPIQGLEPLVSARLPGLSAAQVASLTQRADGNPQFLEEIVRLALDPRNRGMFVDRNVVNALTDSGLEGLLTKSVRLHDVVAERFSSSPEEVQRAVVVAGLQGSQFLLALVADAAGVLEPDTAGSMGVEAALVAAETRHAYLAAVSDDQGAFSQRIYQDVAREFLPAFYDEEEATAAVRSVVADVLHGRRHIELGREATLALWRLGVTLFEESDDVEERRMAVHSLHELSQSLRASGELQVEYAAALRQAALLDTLPDERLDPDLKWLRAVNDTMAAAGDFGVQRDVLMRLVRLTGETYDDDVNAWSAAMYVETLLDVAEFHQEVGDQTLRSQALASAVDVMADLGEVEADVGLFEASLRMHRLYGEWFIESGETQRAVEVQSRAAEIARHLAELDDGPRRRYDMAVVQRQVGRSALMLGDSEAAIAELVQAAGTLRDLLATEPSVTLEIQLASTLDDLADAFTQVDRHAEAEPLLEEGLQVMRRHLALAPEAARTRYNLADALERLAGVRRALGQLDTAFDLSREAVDLRRAIVDQLRTVAAESDLGFTLARAAEVAGHRAVVDDGIGPAREALGLLREAHARDASARSAWRLLFAIRVALPYQIARSGLAAARALLHEADEVYADLTPEAATAARDLMSRIERARAVVLESDGDLIGAAKARAAAAALVEEPPVDGDLGPN